MAIETQDKRIAETDVWGCFCGGIDVARRYSSVRASRCYRTEFNTHSTTHTQSSANSD